MRNIQVQGQRLLGRGIPWCTAPRQLRRPVNTPATDVIMALLRYRTTRSFCWTKTSLSHRWPADPDTTPAGPDLWFIWADVQLTFNVQVAAFHLGTVEHNDTQTGLKQNPQDAAWWATPRAEGHPKAPACGHRGGRCEMFFPVVGVYEHLSARLGDFLTCICNSTSVASAAADG